MAFFIDTDKVSPISDNMKATSTKAGQINSSISSYSIDATEFDFSGAKDAIANNVEGMEIKMKNSSTLINAVVSAHVGYQSSVKGGNNNNNSNNKDSNNYYSGNNNNYDGGTGGGGTGGGGGSYTAPTTTTPETTATPETSTKIPTTEEQSLLVGSMLGNDVKSNIILQTLANTLNLYNIGLAETKKLNELLKKNQKLVLLEGVSTALETVEYTRIVGKVCAEYDIPVKYVNLDKILTYKESEQDEKTASLNAKETISNLTAKEDDEEETKDKELEKDSEKAEEKVDTKETDKDTETEEKKPEDVYEIKDKDAYKALESLKYAKDVKNDLTKTPVTLMIKNNIVVSALNDVVTEEVLKKALEAAGLTSK